VGVDRTHRPCPGRGREPDHGHELRRQDRRGRPARRDEQRRRAGDLPRRGARGSRGGGTVSTLLEIRGLDAGYGDFQALFGVDLSVAEGETLAVIGANGAGKTTLLRTVAGIVPVRTGAIEVAGNALGGVPEIGRSACTEGACTHIA